MSCKCHVSIVEFCWRPIINYSFRLREFLYRLVAIPGIPLFGTVRSTSSRYQKGIFGVGLISNRSFVSVEILYLNVGFIGVMLLAIIGSENGSRPAGGKLFLEQIMSFSCVNSMNL